MHYAWNLTSDILFLNKLFYKMSSNVFCLLLQAQVLNGESIRKSFWAVPNKISYCLKNVHLRHEKAGFCARYVFIEEKKTLVYDQQKISWNIASHVEAFQRVERRVSSIAKNRRELVLFETVNILRFAVQQRTKHSPGGDIVHEFVLGLVWREKSFMFKNPDSPKP